MPASKLIATIIALAVLAPAAATAAIPNPQSDAAMRKGIRDFAKRAFDGKTAKVTKLRVTCVQAAEIGSTRPCRGTFSLTLRGRTAHYRLGKKARTFRISPGAMQYDLRATATRKAPGLPSTIKSGGILQ